MGIFTNWAITYFFVFMVKAARVFYNECILRLKVKWKLSLLLDLVGSNQVMQCPWVMSFF